MAASIFRLGSRQVLRKCSNNVKLHARKTLEWNARFFRTSLPVSGVEGMQIAMPALSPTMSEGKIVKWLKQEGDKVNPGDVLCEIQTDKAVMSFETEEEGIMAKILASEDTDIQVGRLIALMVEDGEDWKDVEIPADTGTPPSGATTEQAPEPAAVQRPPADDNTQAQMSTKKPLGPAVKSLLEIYNISGQSVPPSGPHGRLLKGDVLRFIKENSLEPAAVRGAPPPPEAAPVLPPKDTPSSVPTPPKMEPVFARSGDPYIDIPLSNMRKTIAKRLTESKVSIPHAYSSIDCVMDKLTKLRKEIIAAGNKVTVNDLIIKASALALQRVPEVNSYWNGEQIVRVGDIDISVAVATDSGLITPIVRNAVSLDVPEITKIIRELAGRAREGRLQLHEFQGGSFTISNLGMFGITEFTAIINPPQSCIMAVGTSRLVLDGDNQPRTVMTVTLSCDSRVVDEALASRYLEAFKDIIENPACLTGSQSSIAEDREAFAF